jgi:2-(1,2-epoxy-1,2-dihydrophenyl)acetyl-CoA isomerase
VPVGRPNEIEISFRHRSGANRSGAENHNTEISFDAVGALPDWRLRTLRNSKMSYDTIQVEWREAVCLLTLNRPDRLNALTVEVAHDFQAAVQEALAKSSRAIVLTGAGRAFCAGGDLREMQNIATREGRLEAFFDEPLRILNDAILLIRKTPLPFIAAVNGVASGGGCNLALACDLVIAAESATFNQAFIKIGLSPDCGGTFILPRLVGMKRAAELMFTGDMLTAQSALEIGMINAVTPDGELMSHTLAMADRLAAAPTAAIAQIKKLLEASAINDYGGQLELERKAQIESGQTKDFIEGVTAFLEKRPPRFVGG